MDRVQLALMIGLTCGFIFGVFIARKSNQQQAVRGGNAARLGHFVASAGMGGILPVVLASLLLGQGFQVAFPLAVSFLIVAWFGLLAYAVFERSARLHQEAEDRGWTRDDARKSY